ncbi:MAG: DUF1513 domain-containing protein [Gammaproteobacteria bacterium]|nr:DUF1513 domain-containing protein [Gammaproteobacteria bacterium]MBU1653366.1 DUF1513 domain-containing protein [Gammaproteobacteria bacterium]MBU1962793.1 DUF1513 domain-containing protein [Gammaproteobacteria bacterium]
MNRRHFLLSASAVMAGLASQRPFASSGAEPEPPPGGGNAIYFVPGYRSDLAVYKGEPAQTSALLRKSFPKVFTQAGTLVTRVDERDGSLCRALLPVIGHKISLSPDGRRAFWNSMNGSSMVSFDPDSLALDVFAKPQGKDRIGGGHALYSADGEILFVAERKANGTVRGRPRDHHGLISIRDARTLRVLESYDSQGIGPHDMAILPDGKHLAIAHYGVMNLARMGERPLVVEPSLCILELASGKRVQKWSGPTGGHEVRHLAACGPGRVAAIQINQSSAEEYRRFIETEETISEFDAWASPGEHYLPAPVGFYDADKPGEPPVLTTAGDGRLMLQGQSILYDPRHDEVIATFVDSHAVLVFSGGSGQLKRVIRTDALGLRYPRGVVLHPDGIHYAVSGSWTGIHLFRRGSHEHLADRAIHSVFFNHSHLSVAQA